MRFRIAMGAALRPKNRSGLLNRTIVQSAGDRSRPFRQTTKGGQRGRPSRMFHSG